MSASGFGLSPDCFLCGAAGLEPLAWAGAALVVLAPFWVEAPSKGAGVALRDVSLVENMRVKRSFTEAFSGGLWSCSVELDGTGCPPFWATRLGDRETGDRETRSPDLPDLTDDGCDERTEVGLVSGVPAMFWARGEVLAMSGSGAVAGVGARARGSRVQGSKSLGRRCKRVGGAVTALMQAAAIVAASAPSQRPEDLETRQNSRGRRRPVRSVLLLLAVVLRGGRGRTENSVDVKIWVEERGFLGAKGEQRSVPTGCGQSGAEGC